MLQMTGSDYWVLSSSRLFLDTWKLWSMLFIWTNIYLVFMVIDGIHYIWIEKWILDIFSNDSKLWLLILQGFPCWGDGGRSAHLEKFPSVDSPPPKDNPPTTKQQFSSYIPIKKAFLAVIIAPVSFFLISYSGHTGHVNFDFN